MTSELKLSLSLLFNMVQLMTYLFPFCRKMNRGRGRGCGRVIDGIYVAIANLGQELKHMHQ